jgi:hypothetical protein
MKIHILLTELGYDGTIFRGVYSSLDAAIRGSGKTGPWDMSSVGDLWFDDDRIIERELDAPDQAA